MRLKNIEMELSKLSTFKRPKVDLEQYTTPIDIVSRIITTIHLDYDDIYRKKVLDMCAGTGFLGISALFFEPESVTFIELDVEAADILENNIKVLGASVARFDFSSPTNIRKNIKIKKSPSFGQNYSRNFLYDDTKDACSAGAEEKRHSDERGIRIPEKARSTSEITSDRASESIHSESSASYGIGTPVHRGSHSPTNDFPRLDALYCDVGTTVCGSREPPCTSMTDQGRANWILDSSGCSGRMRSDQMLQKGDKRLEFSPDETHNCEFLESSSGVIETSNTEDMSLSGEKNALKSSTDSTEYSLGRISGMSKMNDSVTRSYQLDSQVLPTLDTPKNPQGFLTNGGSRLADICQIIETTPNQNSLIVSDYTRLPFPTNFFDTVIMNPPFGTKRKHADIEALDYAVKIGKVVYSLHKTSTRKFLQHRYPNLVVLATIKFDIPRMYVFHKQKTVSIDVDFIRIERK